MTETQLTCELCDLLRAHGAEVTAFVAGRMGRKGWPDRYIHHRLWRGWIEFKGAKTPFSPLQQITIRKLAALQPGSCWVGRFSEDGQTIFIETADGDRCASIQWRRRHGEDGGKPAGAYEFLQSLGILEEVCRAAASS